MTSSTNHILNELDRFKKKYFLRLLIKGAVLFFTFILSLFLVFTVLEYIGNFNSIIRLSFLIAFSLAFLFSITKWVVIPLLKFLNNKRELSNELAAAEIGKLMPNISDKLLNTIQLLSTNAEEGDLRLASIDQRSHHFENVEFASSISFDDIKKRYLLFLLIPLGVLGISWLSFPNFIASPTDRILHYNESYAPKAPFNFELISSTKSYISDAYDIQLHIEGNIVIDKCTVNINGDVHTMEAGENTAFHYKLNEVKSDLELVFTAAGYESKRFIVKAAHRPFFKEFRATIEYPSYTNIENNSINSIGSLNIPEGSKIKWQINALYTDSIALKTIPDHKTLYFDKDDSYFTFNRTFKHSEQHTLQAFNKDASSKEALEYNINVIADEFPKINVTPYQDSTLYTYLFINGTISDDYGFSGLRFYYRKTTRLNKNTEFRHQSISYSQATNTQNFNYEVNLDSLKLQEGENIEYYLAVWDNDAVNGRKLTKSRQYSFQLPSKGEIDKEVENASAKSSAELDDALKEAQDLKKKLDEFTKDIKTKKELNWQDKKEIDNILKKHQSLEKKLDNIQQEMEENNMREERFDKMNENIQQKQEELQSLIKDIMDDETKKMMEELNKLMNENLKKDDLEEILEKLNKKDENIENELDRTIEMYKNLKYDKEFEKTKNQLEELAQKQKELAELAKDKDMDSDILKEEQEYLNKEFEELQKKMEELQKDAKELKRDDKMDDLKQDAEDVQQEMKDSKESLEKGKNSKASESQKKAGDKIQEMAQKMAQMQQTEQQETAQENLDDLRDILENLLTLSFNQEQLMKDFKGIRLQDPRFVELSQEQLKLSDDSRMIEDSLLSLAKRVFQIESFVTREVTAMKNHMDDATTKLKERKPHIATSHQQYAMTSMNNLALLLSDVMEQMQQQMAQQMKGDQMCNKPGNNKKPGMGQMQKDLNQMIQQLKDGQKQGRELSKQLGQMAAQQQRIREALKEMQGKEGENGEKGGQLGDELKKLSELMEETEKDLLYKKFDSKTYERNQEILTRLLEAEKAANERGLDKKREAQHSTPKQRTTPPQLDHYLKEKEKQLELIKTIPPGLNPYYKKEVNEYFNTIEN